MFTCIQVPEVPALCGIALSALTYYVEWLDWSELLTCDCKLLRLLYSFISVEQLKTDACECLLAILSRKVHHTQGFSPEGGGGKGDIPQKISLLP